MTEGAAAFTALGTEVRSALSDRGFQTPTRTQRRALPPIAAGEHTLVVAPTGTGKTETAMLPVFDALVQHEDEERGTYGFRALYITPLRALNRDMRERLDWWGEQLDIDVDVRHGDTTDYQRSKQANDPPDVLVTTPETVQAMLTGSKLRTGLESLEHVVIDEVHELAASKRGAQLTVALERRFDIDVVAELNAADATLTVFYTALGTDFSRRGFYLPLGTASGGEEVTELNLITLEQFHGVAEMYYFLGEQGYETRGPTLQARTRTDAIGLPIITIPISNVNRGGGSPD